MELSNPSEDNDRRDRRRYSSSHLNRIENVKVTKDDVETARKMFLGGLPFLPWYVEFFCVLFFFLKRVDKNQEKTKTTTNFTGSGFVVHCILGRNGDMGNPVPIMINFVCTTIVIL